MWVTIEDVGDEYRIQDNATGDVTYCEKGKLNEAILKMTEGGADDEL